MLDQRRAQEKGYITLKEAAALSDYSPDYIGQLIRSGKLKGEQVYSHVAWVTTEEDLRLYMENKELLGKKSTSFSFNALIYSYPFSKYVLYCVIGVLVLLLLFLQYILYVSFDERFSDSLQNHVLNEENPSLNTIVTYE